MSTWQEENQRWLAGALDTIRAALARHAARVRGEEAPATDAAPIAAMTQGAAALETLCAELGVGPDDAFDLPFRALTWRTARR